MTTYTATVSKNDETFTMRELTTKKIKELRKDGYAVVVAKAAKMVNEPAKNWYYRGEMVIFIEDVTNGWTLVVSQDCTRQFRAVTAELEYR